MPSKIAIHFIPRHRDEQDFQILERMQPPSVKLFDDELNDPFFIERMFTMLPKTLFVFRDWHTMGQNQHADEMQADPVGKAKRDADHWKGVVNRLAGVKNFTTQRVVGCGINEPPVWAFQAATIKYYTAFLDNMGAHGLMGGALNLSVGWPTNRGPNTAVDWAPFEPVHAAIVRWGHYLMQHEYWDLAGPSENAGWWAYRIGQCPWKDVKIIIGECGIDRYVKSASYQGTRGWSGHMNAEQYIAQLAEYDRNCQLDPRIHSLQVYTYDYGDNEWASFDVKGIREQLANYIDSQRNVPTPLPRTIPYYPGNVTNPIPPPPPPPPLADNKVMWQKVVWIMEDAARRVRAEGYPEAHDWILASSSYKEAVARRDGKPWP